MVYFCDRSLFSCYGRTVKAGIFAVFLCWILPCCHPSSARLSGHSAYIERIFSNADSFGSDQKERAFAYIDSIYRLFPHPAPEDLYRKYEYKGNCLLEKRDYSRAMIYTDSLLEIVHKESDQKEFAKDYGRALFQKGDVLQGEKQYNDAFLYYFKGAQAIENTLDTCVLSEYSGRLGTICYTQARYREGITYYLKSFGELSRCMEEKDAFKKFVYQQGNLDNIALCYEKMGMNDSAAFFYDSALSYIRHNERSFLADYRESRFVETAKGVIYGNQGDIYFRNGDTSGAEALYRESIMINSQKEYANGDAQITLAKLAGLFLAGRRYHEAEETMEELRQSLVTLPVPDAELLRRQLLWHYSDSMHRTADAYGYLQAYIRLKDSLHDGDRPADVNEAMQHLAHEYELDLLKRQDELKTGYLVIAIIFLVMILIIVGLVWYNWRRSGENVEELTRLNLRIGNHNKHMQKALGALEQSQRENTRMLKVVAHDLRNPIGAIGSIASLLVKKPDLPAAYRAMMELIMTSSQHSLEMITDLLHVNTTREEMKEEPVDMQAVLQYVVDLLRFKAEGKQQHIELRTVPLTLPANREKIWRVLSNLVTNAIKFSPANTNIVVELIRTGDRARISVQDQGIGIPEQHREKVFDLFSEAKRRGTSGEESFGLGLSISKQIVEAHGGAIWYESTEGVGTTFYVELLFERK